MACSAAATICMDPHRRLGFPRHGERQLICSAQCTRLLGRIALHSRRAGTVPAQCFAPSCHAHGSAPSSLLSSFASALMSAAGLTSPGFAGLASSSLTAALSPCAGFFTTRLLRGSSSLSDIAAACCTSLIGSKTKFQFPHTTALLTWPQRSCTCSFQRSLKSRRT